MMQYMLTQSEVHRFTRESSIPVIVAGMVIGFFVNQALILIASLVVVGLIQFPPMRGLLRNACSTRPGLIVLLIWIGMLAVGTLLLGIQGTLRAMRATSEATQRSLLIAWVLALGWLANQLKRRCHFLYGLTEIAFGLVCTYMVAEGIHPGQMTLVHWTAVVASTCIVARGLDNCREARTKVPVVLDVHRT